MPNIATAQVLRLDKELAAEVLCTCVLRPNDRDCAMANR